MSVQFGRWNFEGLPPDPDYIEKVLAVLAPYGPDSDESYAKGGVKILYHALHTTRESYRETQPHVSPSGAVITWDGRLDNRCELVGEFRDVTTIDSTDVAIVAAAYEKWGTNCFAKLIGDWALSIWNAIDRSLVLAKDPIGTHHLYYSFDNNQVTWCTILDPVVLFTGKTFAICEEYVAGWFSSLPAAHLTPYVGVHAVPPSTFAVLRPGKHVVSKYWDFDPGKRIRYRSDAAYEEHFRTIFAKAVQRRLRSDRPILAELSGGMDSSSIVCMADTIIARGEAECPRLDTISYYEDSASDLNERSYLTKVEQKRGRSGYHINLGAKKQIEESEVDSTNSFFSEFESDRFAVTPDSNHTFSPDIFEHYVPYMRSRGYRATLSGIGGEDPTGGFVPTPRLELQNRLARAQFIRLARQLKAWSAKMTKPGLPLLWEAVRGFFPRAVVPDAPPWLSPGFVRRNRAALCGYPSRIKLFAPLPSFQEHIHELNHLQRYLAYHGGLRHYLEMLREVRYPYLDRDMLEFAYAVPRQQIVGVGQRRFLMKRALVGIVPDELLKRKPRAPVTQEPKKDTTIKWPTSTTEMGHHIISSSVGITDSNAFLEALRKARRNEEIPVESLIQTLKLELWLRHLVTERVLTNPMVARKPEYRSSLEAKELQATTQSRSSASVVRHK